MYTGPSFAPIRSINNFYGNGRVSLGSVIALTNTVTTVNALAVGNIVGAAVGGVVGAVVGAIIGPVCKTPNLGRIGHDSKGPMDRAEARRIGGPRSKEPGLTIRKAVV